MSQDWYQDVLEFHRKLAPSRIGTTPKVPSPEMMDQRFVWINEEICECVASQDEDDVVGIADAITDMIYFAIGMSIDCGVDLRPVWDEVHRTNMAKEGGETRADGKLMKPPGWKLPDIKSILERQGSIK